MVAPSFLNARQVARLKSLRQRGFTTVRQFHDDTFQAWTVDRDPDWADTGDVEADRLVASGTGRLYEDGPGGPRSGENVIHVQSPYRFRTLADAPISAGMLLVVNGTRLFRVDDAKREDADDRLMNVYLTELVNTPMPSTPPDPGGGDAGGAP